MIDTVSSTKENESLAAASPPLLRAAGLTRMFGTTRALDGVSMEVQPGEVVALLGPNGAGKTTFQRLALGLIAPTSGAIELLGKTARQLAIDGGGLVGSIGDGPEPPKWMTLDMLEDLQAGAGAGFSRQAFRQSCGGKGLQQSQRYGVLSKGQKRWVLSALALAMQPRMVMFDEPADGLDTAARRGLYDELRSFVTRSQAGAVVATHIISDIERIADHVVILRQGKVLLEAPLEDLREWVREIQRPQGEGPVGAAEDSGIRVLARKTAGNTEIRWVWCESAQALEALGQRWPSIGTVALEDLYLAVTEHALAVEAHA